MNKAWEKEKNRELMEENPKGKHWWDEHLNWVIFLIGPESPPFVISLTILLNSFSQFSVGVFIEYIILALITVYLVWWYLGKKKRSRWWMLLSLLPLGCWLLLFLENKYNEREWAKNKIEEQTPEQVDTTAKEFLSEQEYQEYEKSKLADKPK